MVRMERNKRKRSQRRSAPGQLALFADAHEPEPVANAEAAPEPAVDAETIGRQYGLRERAVTLLAALLRMPDTDGWVGPVSRDELAKAAGQSLATTKRALKDLYLAEVLVCRKRPRGTGGTARSYWVPVVAISR